MLIDLRQNAKRASNEKIFRSTTQIPSRNIDPKKNFFIIFNLFLVFSLQNHQKAKKKQKNKTKTGTKNKPPRSPLAGSTNHPYSSPHYTRVAIHRAAR